MTRISMAIVLALALICGPIGCGFQLRGEARLPTEMAQTWLAVPDPNSQFARELALRLEGAGIALTKAAQPEAAVLRIHSERLQRRPLTISGQARVREFLLLFELEFELLDSEQNVLIERETLRLSREYSFDEQAILAASREEEFLRDELRRSMAAQLIRRLEAAPDL